MKTITSKLLYHAGDIACRVGWYSAYSWLMLKSADLDANGDVWKRP